MKTRLIGLLIISVYMSACSIIFGEREKVVTIPITTKAATPLVILFPKVYLENGHLNVVGTVDSSDGEHSYESGSVVVCVFSKEGVVIKEVRGHFGSHEIRQGPASHSHTDRTFSVDLDIKPEIVSKIDIYPDLPGLGCS